MQTKKPARVMAKKIAKEDRKMHVSIMKDPHRRIFFLGKVPLQICMHQVFY